MIQGYPHRPTRHIKEHFSKISLVIKDFHLHKLCILGFFLNFASYLTLTIPMNLV